MRERVSYVLTHRVKIHRYREQRQSHHFVGFSRCILTQAVDEAYSLNCFKVIVAIIEKNGIGISEIRCWSGGLRQN